MPVLDDPTLARVTDARLLAWTHDPGEKAFVLGAPGGHEGGTVAALRETLFPAGVPEDLGRLVRSADHLAAAADWAAGPDRLQVSFRQHPVLRHPVCGAVVDLGSLTDIDVDQVAFDALAHYQKWIVPAQGRIDRRRTAWSFWRNVPDPGELEAGLLWPHLPADTRVPNHSIWSHLDLTAAIAAAAAADPQQRIALLLVTLGPVQSLIAQARATVDLWAGSHLLATLCWSGVQQLAEELGPESILFPQLRGLAPADDWLRGKGIELARVPQDAQRKIAALPNRFLAIVPAAFAETYGRALCTSIRTRLRDLGQTAAKILLEQAGRPEGSLPETVTALVADQLDALLDIRWTAVHWADLATTRETVAAQVTGQERSLLRQALQWCCGEDAALPGVFAPDVAPVVARGIDLPDLFRYLPNAGVLYGAAYELLERMHAADRAGRGRAGRPQQGYRCSLCGERAWLTDDPQHWDVPPGQRTATLWTQVAQRAPSIARQGEHLCAVCTLKRLWPRVLQRENQGPARLYVVSTHTMARVPWLRQLVRQPVHRKRLLDGLADQTEEWTALPHALARLPESAELRKLVQALDAHDEGGLDSGALPAGGGERLPGYYAWILFDGDRLGAWLSGTHPATPSWKQALHPRLGAEIDGRLREAPEAQREQIRRWLLARQMMTPARHAALSEALRQFAGELVPDIVERRSEGALIYAGGDDVLAMAPADAAIAIAWLLRCAYAGTVDVDEMDAVRQALDAMFAATSPTAYRPVRLDGLRMQDGYVLRSEARARRLNVTMGPGATASAGIVVAHHKAPMGRVLRALRAAEQRAKVSRDACHITVLKRAGESVDLLLPWRPRGGFHVAALYDLAAAYRHGRMSRRFGFSLMHTLRDGALGQASPQQGDRLRRLLSWEMKRHSVDLPEEQRQRLVARLVDLATGSAHGDPARQLHAALACADMLARPEVSGRVTDAGSTNDA